MQAEAPTSPLNSILGTAHLAWAAALCAGGIYGLSAGQPPNRELAESLGAWSQGFAAAGVSSLVSLAFLHGWGGQSLRREGIWPAVATWGLLIAGTILALVALGILMRGIHSRLLLAGGAPLVAVLLAGGAGTIGLTIATRWIAGPREIADPHESDEEVAESSLLRISLAALPGILAATAAVVAGCCELAGG